MPPPIFKKGVIKLDDLAAGMELAGTVLNVVDFGAFVDIGLHDTGLVHISQLANKYVRDPHEVVSVGDIVKVWVHEIDKTRRRVSLTMIAPGTERTAAAASREAEERRAAASSAQRRCAGGAARRSSSHRRPSAARRRAPVAAARRPGRRSAAAATRRSRSGSRPQQWSRRNRRPLAAQVQAAPRRSKPQAQAADAADQ